MYKYYNTFKVLNIKFSVIVSINKIFKYLPIYPDSYKNNVEVQYISYSVFLLFALRYFIF